MGALRALLPACALGKGRGRRGQPSDLPGAGAPPRCSAGGGAHQVNAARKTLARLLAHARASPSGEGGAGHTHVRVSHDPAWKERKTQGISRPRPHSSPRGPQLPWQSVPADKDGVPGVAGPLLSQAGHPPPLLRKWRHYLGTPTPQRTQEGPAAGDPTCNQALVRGSASGGPAQTGGRVTPKPAEGASCPPYPSLGRDQRELGPGRLTRTRLQGQEVGGAP